MTKRIGRLVQRGLVFYFRRRVPRAYVSFLSWGAIVVSLRTKELSCALVRWAHVNQAVDTLFKMIDENGDLDANALKAYFQGWLRDALGLNGTMPTTPAPGDTQASLNEALKNEDGELYDIGFNQVQSLPVFEPHRHLIQDKHYADLGKSFVLAQIEILRQQDHMAAHGELAPTNSPLFADMPELTKIAPAGSEIAQGLNPSSKNVSAPLAAPRPIHTIQEVFEAFKAEDGAHWGKRAYKFENAYRILDELYGGGSDIQMLEASHAREVKALLLQLPKNASKSKRYKNLALKEQAVAAQASGDKIISEKTVKDRVGHISVWLNWAVGNKYLKENHFKGLVIKKQTKANESREPFTQDQLAIIFGSPIYTGMKSKTRRTLPGSLIIKNIDYWAPIIALYHGMRIEEICQLHLKNVSLESGIWVFDLKSDSDLAIKSQAGRRRVPIHKKLLDDWNFEAWLKSRIRSNAKDDLLFDDVELGKDGRYASAYGKRFNRDLRSIGIDDKRLVFHSFRHTAIDAMRDAGLEKSISQALVGHESKDVHDNYGRGYSVAILKQELDKIRFNFAAPMTR